MYNFEGSRDGNLAGDPDTTLMSYFHRGSNASRLPATARHASNR